MCKQCVHAQSAHAKECAQERAGRVKSREGISADRDSTEETGRGHSALLSSPSENSHEPEGPRQLRE